MKSIKANIEQAEQAISLRRMTHADVPAVAKLARRIWRSHYPGIISKEQIEYMLEKNYGENTLTGQLEDKQYTLLACQDDELVGYISIKSEDGPGEYFISRLYVDTELHGAGIGQMLLEQAIIDHAPVKQLALNVNRQNIKAINFYFRRGFIIEHCMDTDFGGGYFMNDFRMVLKL